MVLESRQRPEPRGQSVDPRGRGPQSRHEARPRRIAQWRLALRICEQRPPGRQRVDIRSLDLRMPVQAAEPVVLVVDRNEQNVWFRSLFRGGRCRQQAVHGHNHSKPADPWEHGVTPGNSGKRVDVSEKSSFFSRGESARRQTRHVSVAIELREMSRIQSRRPPGL